MADRKLAARFWVPLLFGLISLTTVIGRPTFASIRAVDAVQLIATGMCFGAAIVALGAFLRGQG